MPRATFDEFLTKCCEAQTSLSDALNALAEAVNRGEIQLDPPTKGPAVRCVAITEKRGLKRGA